MKTMEKSRKKGNKRERMKKEMKREKNGFARFTPLTTEAVL